MDATVIVGGQGRLVIPASIRAALHLEPGDRLHAQIQDGRLVLERPETAVAELHRLVADVPTGRSLVDELLRERRAEALTE
ncbi:MAG: hypothetical protein QOJ32_2490 [Frankiaceae bacterium]|jgi:AbrB family looped-hinge helix DNA binding protein|nr:hypothetical protein [Frankiaceae bacterium]MDQ1674275.1 hypothetical protein [Frankiaceae bacterium]